MGYSSRAARYVKFYRNVSESNVLVGEDQNQRAGSNGSANLNNPTTYFYIKIDIERSSTFYVAFEYRTNNNMDLNLEAYVNDALVYSATLDGQAAFTAASFDLAPYNDAGVGLYLNDKVSLCFYGDGIDNYYVKLFQIFGFETPIDPKQYMPA